MDKITKFLMKLSYKEREIILGLLEKILGGQWEDIVYTKLIGYKNMYRVRKGSIRIVFSVEGNNTKIINIDYRGSVYKDI